jgi:hypothetical protein
VSGEREREEEEEEDKLEKPSRSRRSRSGQESAPDDRSHSMQDPTARGNGGDVDHGSLEEPYGYSRG